jgi:hypothetical protein
VRGQSHAPAAPYPRERKRCKNHDLKALKNLYKSELLKAKQDFWKKLSNVTIYTDGSKTENHFGASMVAEKRLQGNTH